jgi:hypothetical protein
MLLDFFFGTISYIPYTIIREKENYEKTALPFLSNLIKPTI